MKFQLSTHLDIVTAHVDVVRAQVEVCRRYRTHSPLCLAGERVALVVGGGAGDNFVAMFVH